MVKVVVNTRFGGFGVSEAGICQYEAYSGLKRQDVCQHEPAFRACPHLVRVVEEMGRKADGPFAELAVVEVPDEVQWEIAEYDGKEWVAEAHRRWGDAHW
jgi:hypothetical protein